MTAIPGNAVILDPLFGSSVINTSGLSTSDVYANMADEDRAVLRAMAEWSQATQTSWDQRNGGLLARDRFSAPKNIYDQMRLARIASETDDVVSVNLNATESLAFSKVEFWCEDSDEEDVWNQIAGELDLDSRLREMWRELAVASQIYPAVWWSEKTFTVRGKTKAGVKRKKQYKLKYPKAITLLDPTKVIPLGNLMFNQEDLVYIADRGEASRFDQVLLGDQQDEIVKRLITGRYEPTEDDRKLLSSLGVAAGSSNHLFKLDPRTVWRHTTTRPQFQRFAPVKLTSVFELLDMKYQLRQMDRAHLIGGTNFIVLITKGSEKYPAKNSEIANLQTMVRSVGRLPVLVGDHRLQVEIVTPKLDNTVKAERYNVLDSRITANQLQLFSLGNYHAGASGDKSEDLVRVIAKGMESTRSMLRRSLEAHMFDRMFDENDDLTEKAKLKFRPARIALSFDQAWSAFLIQLRESQDLSRETILSQFDMDQDEEAQLKKREKELYDDIFETLPPPGSPGPMQPVQPAGPIKDPAELSKVRRQGGRKGGAAPGTGQGKPPASPTKRSDSGRDVPVPKADDDDVDDEGNFE